MLFLDPGHPYSDIVGAYQGKYTIIGDEVLEKGISANEFIRQLKGITGKESPDSKLLIVPEEESQKPIKQIGTESPGIIYNVVMSENFEGTFPSSGWTVQGGGGPYWGATNNFYHSGSKSAWCARSGPGGVDPRYYYYPNNVNSWMTYGPFSLYNIQSALVHFYYWNRSESNHDYFKWMVSIDNNYFYGYQVSGDSGGWIEVTFNLTNVPGLGNVCGKPQVWIAFLFTSDWSVVDYGAYVDDVSLSVSLSPVINSLTPSSASAGTYSVVTINGNNFGSTQGEVYFRATGTNHSAPNTFLKATIISWSNTEIKCYVPIGTVSNYPYSAGSFNNAIYVYNGIWSNGHPFSVTFGYSGNRWATDTVHYFINENTNDSVGEGAAVKAAGDAWNNYSNFSLYYDGPTSSIDYGRNGKNEILWVNYNTYSLATTSYWVDLNGIIIECDIRFNDISYDWSTSGHPSSGQFDVQSVAVHEFGHWLNLLDLYGDNDTTKVMYGINNGGLEGVKRSLTLDDIAGIQYIYGIPETITPPSTPSGPTSGFIGTSFTYSTGGSSSNLGHLLEYQFDWKGDGTDLSLWGSATQSKTWTVSGTYQVRARARCTSHTLVVSSWSGTLSVTITPAETVSTPSTPSGTTSGNTGISYTYSTGGASSNLGHSLEYRFDWGDGTYSNWSSSTSASKSWSSAGTYSVRAQARCATHTSVVSSWSSGLSVNVIADNVFLDVPSGYWAYDYIIAIYNNGITTGCVQDDPSTPQNERRYCPEDSVTRGQMAAFIIRVKYGENFTYTQTPYFSDVPSNHTFFKYVQKMKDEGLTAVSGVYMVDEPVTRGQMAAFIIRAKFGENFTYTTTPYFTDVPSTHSFFKYVQKMKDEGITAVTGTYGVDNIVTRAQMAAFLARAFLGME